MSRKEDEIVSGTIGWGKGLSAEWREVDYGEERYRVLKEYRPQKADRYTVYVEVPSLPQEEKPSSFVVEERSGRTFRPLGVPTPEDEQERNLEIQMALQIIEEAFPQAHPLRMQQYTHYKRMADYADSGEESPTGENTWPGEEEAKEEDPLPHEKKDIRWLQ